MYDPRVGRWMSRDPFEGKYPTMSTYGFVANSPVMFIDPNGKDIWLAFKWTGGQSQEGNYQLEGHVVLFVTTYKEVTVNIKGESQIFYVESGVKLIENNNYIAHDLGYQSDINLQDHKPLVRWKKANYLDYDGGVMIKRSPLGRSSADLGLELDPSFRKDARLFTFDEVKEELDVYNKAQEMYNENYGVHIFKTLEYNCTDFVVELIQEIGIAGGPDLGKQTVPNQKTNKEVNVSTPNALYNDLKASGYQSIEFKPGSSEETSKKYLFEKSKEK